jgi:hypothetical protein
VIDRASTFSDPEVVDLLRTKFVPVATDVWYFNRRKDQEGEFYRKVTSQGPRKAPDNTQGLYVFDAEGKLLGFTHRSSAFGDRADYLKRELRKGLETFKPPAAEALPNAKEDPWFARRAPEGGLVVKVTSKVMGGYEEAVDPLRKLFQESMGEDNLWVRKDEAESLARGELPESLVARIAAYHLIDNTRGEPPMWGAEGVKRRSMKRDGNTVRGSFGLGSDARGAELDLLGFVEAREGKVVRFDLVATGRFWDEKTDLITSAPKGKYPVAIAFRLASMKEEADRLPPQGARDLRDYLR